MAIKLNILEPLSNRLTIRGDAEVKWGQLLE
jgi:hypothetical protein